MKNSITHRYYFCWCPRYKFHQPVYSSHYILQNVWMSTFNKHTLCYNIETSIICAISAYTFFSFSESLDIARCDFKTEMIIYIFKYIQLCPLIPVDPHFNKSSAVITWQNAFLHYIAFLGRAVSTYITVSEVITVLIKYYACKCPSCTRHQYISNHNIEVVNFASYPCLWASWESSSKKTFIGLVLENETEKQQYTYFFFH